MVHSIRHKEIWITFFILVPLHSRFIGSSERHGLFYAFVWLSYCTGESGFTLSFLIQDLTLRRTTFLQPWGILGRNIKGISFKSWKALGKTLEKWYILMPHFRSMLWCFFFSFFLVFLFPCSKDWSNLFSDDPFCFRMALYTVIHINASDFSQEKGYIGEGQVHLIFVLFLG